MASIAPGFDDTVLRSGAPGSPSAVSWPAVFAGATAAASLSLILLVLGTGLGLSAASPWTSRGTSAETISWSTIIWISFTALASSGLGGYIAGRLRVKWPSVHTDEVYFRDTAHGFLAWAVATLITAAALTSTIGAILGAGASAGANVAAAGVQVVGQGVASNAAQPGGRESSPLYFIDSLFRAPPATADGTAASGMSASQSRAVQPGPAGGGAGAPAAGGRDEIARIFDNTIHDGALSADDTRYLGQLVAQRTGLSQADAEARVTSTYAAAQKKLQDAEANAKALADRARKAGAYTALWLFISLLLGAFFASLMATVGGRRRDLA